MVEEGGVPGTIGNVKILLHMCQHHHLRLRGLGPTGVASSLEDEAARGAYSLDLFRGQDLFE
jgi:hypothetical protein